MVRRPVVSSIRSRQTGQVGNSTSDGVGGGNGLRARLVPILESGATPRLGVNGSWLVSGKEGLSCANGVWKTMDLINITWQFSGYNVKLA